MKHKNFYIVIFAGGSGTRLWPMSRQQMPKQFHILTGKRSLLQNTFDRVAKAVDRSHIFVLTTEPFKAETEKQLSELPPENILIEPMGRNTTAATALAMAAIAKIDPEAIVATLPSDHVVTHPDRFIASLLDAYSCVSQDHQAIVTIGIQPTHPNTGLGYIQKGKLREEIEDLTYPAFKAERFVEKPDLATAKRYLRTGNYFWNAGYFVWHVSAMRQALEEYGTETLQKIDQYMTTKAKGERETIYESIPSTPIDISVMEHYSDLLVIPADLGWSDVGSWSSLHEILKLESGADSIIKGDHIGVDTENVLILGHNKLIATAGLKDVIVVDTPDVMLICHKDKAQDIKKILEQLTEQGRETYL